MAMKTKTFLVFVGPEGTAAVSENENGHFCLLSLVGAFAEDAPWVLEIPNRCSKQGHDA